MHDVSPKGGAWSSVGKPAGWLRRGLSRLCGRHPLLIALLASAGLLGLLQAGLFLSVSQAGVGGWMMFLGMIRLGMIIGFVTILVLAPLVAGAARLHPDWKTNRSRAYWAVSVVVAAGIGSWIPVEGLLAIPAAALKFWVHLAVVLAIAWGASFLKPPARVLKWAAVLSATLILASFFPVGMGGSAAPDQSTPAATAASGAPDIVLICVDTLRADRLGAYGSSASLTPGMDRLAREGVVFDRALASSPWTVPSVASMLTGLPTIGHQSGFPLSSGMTFLRSPLEEKFTTLAERFGDAGYRTRAVVSNPFLSPEMGFAQGFQEYDNPYGAVMAQVLMSMIPLGRVLAPLIPFEKLGDMRAEGVTQQALHWWREEDPRPLFLWAHYLDPHSPYRADPRSLDIEPLIEEMLQQLPAVREDGTVVGEAFAATSAVRSGMLWLGPQDRERLRDYYDRSVRYVDEEIDRLLQAVREGRRQRGVVVALTSDHGEEFWDHGHFEHGHDYYREVTWIPLILWGPGVIPAGVRLDAPVGLVDVGPTLADLGGLEPIAAESADQGRTLRPLWEADGRAVEPQRIRFSGGNLYGLPATLAEDGPWRFILRANGSRELYHVNEDPEERFNRASEHADLSARFEALLAPRLSILLQNAGQTETTTLSPEALEALRSLGYVQ